MINNKTNYYSKLILEETQPIKVAQNNIFNEYSKDTTLSIDVTRMSKRKNHDLGEK